MIREQNTATSRGEEDYSKLDQLPKGLSFQITHEWYL